MSVKVRERPPKSGVWWIFIDHKGKRKAKKIGTDKRLALEVAKKIEAHLILGDLKLLNNNEKRSISFRYYAELWLNQYIKGIRKPSTYERYQDALKRYVYPALGNKEIDEIRRGEIRNLLLSLYNKGVSKSMIIIIHATISGPMSYALDDEIIQANPVTGLTKRLQLQSSDSSKIQPMTRSEVDLFIDTCIHNFRDYYSFFLCAFRTGMRLGELLGLQWGDVDWHGKFIEVSRSYKTGRIGTTKTGKTRRVDMSDNLIDALRGLYLKRQKEAIREGRGEVIESIFHRSGCRIEQNFIRRIFKRILVKSGLRDMRFHDIRHTFASLLLSDGASLVYVKEQMGHSSIQMTVDIYGHLIPGSNRESINRLDTHSSATYTQPQKRDAVQPTVITPHFTSMVPKPGFECKFNILSNCGCFRLSHSFQYILTIYKHFDNCNIYNIWNHHESAPKGPQKYQLSRSRDIIPLGPLQTLSSHW